MEPTAAWGPSELQELANWTTVEEPAAEVWASPGVPPLEYASIDIFGTCSLQEYVPESSGGQQLPEHYYYSAASQHVVQSPVEQAISKDDSGSTQPVDDPQDREATKIFSDYSPIRHVLEQVADEFKVDIDLMDLKMHRYPESFRALGENYNVPRIVAIGPYHHHRTKLIEKAEKVKHVAASHCVGQSDHLLEELYSAVASVADGARRLYNKDVMEGIGCHDFRHMMFFDACFLVQYMRVWSGSEVDPSLYSFMRPNLLDIHHDITLLENQLPWKVLKTVMEFTPVPLKRFISISRDYLQAHKPPADQFKFEEYYEPPHLLGLLRYYTVGRSDHKLSSRPPLITDTRSISYSVSATELAEIGFQLTPNRTAPLIDMGMEMKSMISFFPKLYLPPLSIDNISTSFLVNMAAHEMCSIRGFIADPVEHSAVCSYLLLLSTILTREEDVHELRTNRVLQGGAGLADSEVLKFFKGLPSLRLGRGYVMIMKEIEDYRMRRRVRTRLYAFVYNNLTTILPAFTILVGVISIIGTLKSLNTRR